MMPKTLFETTLDPEKRTLLRIVIPEEEAITTDRTVHELMGKDAAVRRAHIMEGALDVADEIDV